MKFKFLNLAFSSFHNLFRTHNLCVKPGAALGWSTKIVYSTKSNFKIIRLWQDKNTTPEIFTEYDLFDRKRYNGG